MEPMLQIKDLRVEVDGKEILKGINLKVNKGEIHAIMGPNGTGKSTLAYAIAGHPKYKITNGSIIFNGKDMTKLAPYERAKEGLFLAFQYPTEISGVNISHFLYTISKLRNNLNPLEFRKQLIEKGRIVNIDKTFLDRQLNVGFSGGEKKILEILQMLMINPKFAVLDETDSGLDIDSLQTISNAINQLRSDDFSALVVTHYQRILNFIKPDFIHVLIDGNIVKTGDFNLAKELESKGYTWLNQDFTK
ncbi:MAG: Fe-S cluster assembly ATPase SufC [Nanoarchaeota archaeon]